MGKVTLSVSSIVVFFVCFAVLTYADFKKSTAKIQATYYNTMDSQGIATSGTVNNIPARDHDYIALARKVTSADHYCTDCKIPSAKVQGN